MRMLSSFATAGLALAVLATSGCCSWLCPCDLDQPGRIVRPPKLPQVGDEMGGPSKSVGVVEIMRQVPMGPEQLVGFVTKTGDYSFWLLNGTEHPPVMPGSPGMPIIWRFLNNDEVNVETWCTDPNYGGQLTDPQNWALTRTAEGCD